jgi:hypothetical protein
LLLAALHARHPAPDQQNPIKQSQHLWPVAI